MNHLNKIEVESVKIKKLPMDLEAFLSISTGKGIRLTSVESFDKKNQRIYEGLQSEFFGTDFSSDWAFKERYACKCKKYLGKKSKGTICDVCGTRVEYHDVDLTKCGWIILDHHQVISPIYSAKLAEAFGRVDGKTVLSLILARRYHEEDHPDYNEKELEILKKHPYILKGMTWLSKNLNEVLEYYKRKKPTKRKLFDELIKEQDIIFTHSIRVYTSLLRTELPGEKGNKNFKLKINTHFKSIIRLANNINEYEGIKDYDSLNTIDIYLAAMQKEIDTVFDVTYNDMTHKFGTIMGKVLSGRYNFSARSVITPDSGLLRADEIVIGYIPFMELYRYELQNFYRKLYDCTPAIADSMWKKALHRFDPRFYSIIEDMCTDEKKSKHLGVLLNRNPSLIYEKYR